MAYEVTATRRRPKIFDEMAGQDFVVATLKSSIVSGRIAHAYLFSGPRGCGKTSAARILARSLNCEKGPTATPCGECPACVEIARGASLDVIEIDGASNTSVNDVRQIKDEVLFPPNSGRYKIYIIDEVHMLSNSAFNALLKTIEEPPPYIVFIFATTELHKVPATIKSRCQQFNFRLFSIDTIKNLLSAACAEAGLEAEDEALFWIAKEATGSMRDAYTLFDQVASFSDGRLSAELIRDKLGLVGLDAINDFAEACADGRTADALSAIDDILGRGVALEQFVVDLAEFYRSLLLLKHGIDRESLLGHNPDRYSRKALDSFNEAQMERALSLLLDLYRDIRFSVSPRFELETAAARLSRLRSWVSPAELRAAIDGVRGSLLSPSTQARSGPDQGSDTAQAASPRMDASSTPALETRPAASSADEDSPIPGGLSAGFKRFMAERENKTIQPTTTEPSPAALHLPADRKASDDNSTAGRPSPTMPDKATDIETEEASERLSAAPKDSSLDLDDLRQTVIAALKKDRGMISSGLEKSEQWSFENGKIIIRVYDSFSVELLKKDMPVIASCIRDITGTAYETEFRETATGTKQSQSGPSDKIDIPPQVEVVRRLFRGTVVKSPAQRIERSRHEHQPL